MARLYLYPVHDPCDLWGYSQDAPSQAENNKNEALHPASHIHQLSPWLYRA